MAVGPAGLDELLDAQTFVYPVPSSGIVNISNSSKEGFAAKLTDQTGRTIQEFEVKQGIETLDLGFLSTGVYTITLTQNDITINKRVVIQK